MTRTRWGITTGVLVVALSALAILTLSKRSPVGSERSKSMVTTEPASDSSGIHQSLSLHQNAGKKISLGDIAAVPFQEFYNLLSQQKPEEIAALARQLEALPAGVAKDAKISALFKVWVAIDAESAVNTAAKLGDRPARNAALSAAVDGVAPSSAGTVVEAILHLPENAVAEKPEMLNESLTKFSQADPGAAAQFLERADTIAAFARVENGVRPDLAAASTWTGVAENFAAKDPSAAMDWAKRVDASNHGEFAIQGAIRGWWQKEPKAAADYVVVHAGEPAGQQMATNLATSMAMQDPAKAVKWVDQLPNEETRKQAASGLVEVMSHRDPPAAARLMQNMPAGMEQTMALATVVSGWAEKDPQSAAQWIGALNGPMQDEAMGIFSSSIASQDPGNALSWAESISDQAKRDRYLQQIARDWLNQNPAAARIWIQNSSLADAEKAHLLSLAPKS